MKINEISKVIHENNIQKGFYEDEKNIGEMLALIHSEVSEALEADRNGIFCMKGAYSVESVLKHQNHYIFKNLFEGSIKNTFEDELADIMIRVMDLAAFKNIDLEAHIQAKMKYNSLREYKHGKKY